ncbi:MAG TPA: VOC family protein [Caulobacteraceae bacterium]|jgi:catechol 2,3-dioxygenase-like lactoylglutathione lyase family enzyme
MITGFARIDIAAHDAARAGEAYGAFLGREPAEAARGFRLANVTLRVRAAAADEREGLARIVFAARDLSQARRMLERRGVATREEGAEVVLEPAASHGVGLALEAAAPGKDDEAPTVDDRIAGLDHVVIRTPDPERAIALYGARLGLDFRLDRSNPAWGSRLLFFRCGNAVVEIATGLESARSDSPDALSGLAFRATDPDAVRERLAKSGFDVSEARAGRKPGTRVFTLRSGVVGAPALVIGGQSPDD